MQTRISETEAKRMLERYDALRAIRAPWESAWQKIALFTASRDAAGPTGTVNAPPGEGDSARLFDTTAITGAQTLSSGCLAWMSPQESKWFAFATDELAHDDEEKRWLNRATRVAQLALTGSDFYTEVHEFYLDRSTFGIGCLYLERGTKKKLRVQCWPVGSYVFDEDAEGNISTVIREDSMTIHAAVEEFGLENMSEAIRKKSEKGGSEEMEHVKYLHFIYYRPEKERVKGSLAPEDMPIASVYMEKDTRHVIKVSGHGEMPVMISRYLKWRSHFGKLYGWSPAFLALPDSRQVNFLQKMMDAMAEKAAFPPVLAPEELEGEIDPNAAGVTYFDQSIATTLPREWQTAGRYDIGKDRIIEKQTSIRNAYHTDLFQMFSQLDKQMTAREVAERSSEKLIQFSPTFARLTTELFNPLLERVFSICLDAGWFGEVPESMKMDIGNGLGYVAPPEIIFSSRIALAMRSMAVLSVYRVVELLKEIAALQVTGAPVLDNVDWDAVIQMVLLNESLPDEVTRPKADVAAMRQARADELAKQQELEQAAATADAAAKVGKIPNDSPVGQAIGRTLDQAA